MYSRKSLDQKVCLSPIELFQVLSNGKIDEMEFRKDVRSEWYLNNWEKTHNHKTITKNHCLTKERSIQIYLTPEDPLHQRQVEDNGRIWGRVTTLAKRQRNLSLLEI